MYRVKFDGKAYDLPKYSVKIANQIETLDNLEGDIEFKLRSMYEFVESIIGTEKTIEALGAFDEADPNLINILFVSIITEYNRPYTEYQRDETLKQYSDPRIKDAIKVIDTVVEANKND